MTLNCSYSKCRFFVVSLLLLVCATVHANDWTALRSSLDTAQTTESARSKVNEFLASHPNLDDDLKLQLKSSMDQATGESKRRESDRISSLKSFVSALELSSATTDNAGVKGIAEDLKRDPVYHRTTAKSSNWLSKTIANIWEWFNKLFKKKEEDRRPLQNPAAWLSALSTIVYWVVIALLVVIVGVFVFYMVRAINLKRSQRRTGKASVIDDLEIIKTEDEYLREADGLIAQGRFREAIRSLYLACLLSIDAIRIAKFERSETNWEHLRRIESSRTKPEAFEFRSVTRIFDRVWYGFELKGMEDVDFLRAKYLEIKALKVENPR